MNDSVLAARWYDAWNKRDLNAILELYAEEIEFASPYAAALGFAPDGVVHGKAMLKMYFERALQRAPELHFTPEALCVGARSHTLIYRNHRGELAAESHECDGLGRIIRADATYEASE